MGEVLRDSDGQRQSYKDESAWLDMPHKITDFVHDEWRNHLGDPAVLRKKDLIRALEALPDIRADQSIQSIVNRIQQATLYCFNWKTLLIHKPNTPASQIARSWKALANQLDTIHRKLNEIRSDTRTFSDWHSAGGELARGGANPPPRLNPEHIEIPALEETEETLEFLKIWPVNKGFDEFMESLDWVVAVTKQCHVRATQETKDHGSPEPNEPDHTLVRTLASIFHDATGIVAESPSANRESGEPVGKFFEFSYAVFDPLDERNEKAIASLIRRALSP